MTCTNEASTPVTCPIEASTHGTCSNEALSMDMITIEEGELLEGIRNVVFNKEYVKEAVIITSEIGHITGVVESIEHLLIMLVCWLLDVLLPSMVNGCSYSSCWHVGYWNA
jgi:hypothetical protein